MIRYARFTLSGLLLIVFLGISCLWVRNSRTKDILWINKGGGEFYRVSSGQGRIIFSVKRYNSLGRSRSWWIDHTRPGNRVYDDDFGNSSNSHWFQTMRWKSGLKEYHLPLWMPLIASAILALVMSPKRQFSMRTLLIAVSIFALLLGLSASLHPVIPETQSRTGF